MDRSTILRASPLLLVRGEEGEPLTLHGYFARFNVWAEIDSVFEGTFLERISPGAFSRTFAEDRSRMRVLFQHGRDPVAGSKPLGPIVTLREDGAGALYEVPLLDTGYVREIVPGLRAGLYGSSFRFRVTREEVVERPPLSGYNPRGLPERTILEARVVEFGPVSFPAYDGTTAEVRSLTDWYRTA
jgi:HK97 family phage prohead protease